MLIGDRRPTAHDDLGIKQLVKEIIRFLSMHPLPQCPHGLSSSLFAGEPFQNQVSSRHQRILSWVILLVDGVPGSQLLGNEMSHCTNPVQVLKSISFSLQKPRLSQACAHTTQPLPCEVRHSHGLSPLPHTWRILTFHVQCLWHE